MGQRSWGRGNGQEFVGALAQIDESEADKENSPKYDEHQERSLHVADSLCRSFQHTSTYVQLASLAARTLSGASSGAQLSSEFRAISRGHNEQAPEPRDRARLLELLPKVRFDQTGIARVPRKGMVDMHRDLLRRCLVVL